MRALEAVMAHVLEDRTVDKVSYGTGMGDNLDLYRRIPYCPMAYGQTLAAMALCERLKSVH